MSTTVYQKRLARCRTAMREHGVDTLLITPGAAMRYLTGFSEEGYERLLCLIVPDDRPLSFISPALNADQVATNPAGIADLRVWTDSVGWERPLRQTASELDLNIGIVGVDDNMPARFLLKILEIMPQALVKSAGAIFAELRSVKDDDELAAMRAAAALTDAAYHAALHVCRPGVTEAAIAQTIQQTIVDGGGSLAFDTIVGSGPNSALPHHRAGSRQVCEGEIVLFDLGAQLNGYCGDITRVARVGDVPDKPHQVYETVYHAQQRALESVKPGTPASFIDSVARQVIGEAGYEDFFIHRTGHGIGLEDHEAPNIVHGNDVKLEVGNCFSIEPGIYLPGNFGVRLENIVTVTHDGGKPLNEPIPSKLCDVRELAAQ
jgi:Xaa-Pro aminopeptidase